MKTTTPVERATSSNSSIASSPAEHPSSQVMVGKAPHCKTNSFISAIWGKEPESGWNMAASTCFMVLARIRSVIPRPSGTSLSSSAGTPSFALRNHEEQFLLGIELMPSEHKPDKGDARSHYPWAPKVSHHPRNLRLGVKKSIYPLDHCPVPLFRGLPHAIKKCLGLGGDVSCGEPRYPYDN